MNKRFETIQLLDKAIEGKLLDAGLVSGGFFFLDFSNFERVNKWDSIKPKNFCKAREIVNKMKR